VKSGSDAATADQPQYDQQDHGADEGYEDGSGQAAERSRPVRLAKHEATDEGADDADDDIADDAVARADDHRREHTGHETDKDPGENVHDGRSSISHATARAAGNPHSKGRRWAQAPERANAVGTPPASNSRMRRYAAVLLDVDGTLVDSNDAHAHAWCDAFAARDVGVDFARVRSLIGMGGDRLIELVAGYPRGSRDSKRLAKQRTKIFRERWLPTVKPLLGARELLLRLRAEQYPYVIASAANADELAPLLELTGIADLCERRTSSSEVEESKPDPEIIEVALAQLPCDRSRVVMIGDTPYDLEAARGAAVDFLGFTSGGWPHEALAGAVAIRRGPASLLAEWLL
jgi:phosphoglycolate phosphatase-like HAD superfamily hydrolase